MTKLELEVVGSTNDSKHYEDPTRMPEFDNFEAQPSISGGAEGAFNPDLYNRTPEPPTPRYGLFLFIPLLGADNSQGSGTEGYLRAWTFSPLQTAVGPGQCNYY